MDRRLVMIVNPRGGKRLGIKVLNSVLPVFTRAGIEVDVRLTERSAHASEIVQSLNLAQTDGICVVGGDGTIHEVADSLMQRGQPVCVPLGIIPAGTGNTLAQHLDCADPLKAAHRIVDGQTQPLDVIAATVGGKTVYCTNIVGFGAVSDINLTAEKLRRLGPPRYSIAALWQMMNARPRRAKIMLDDKVIDDEFLFAVACNGRYTGANMKLTPRAEISDGKVDVAIIRSITRWQMLRLFSKVFDGSHTQLGYIEFHQVRSFSIHTETDERLNLDGEMKGTTPVEAHVLPSALMVFA